MAARPPFLFSPECLLLLLFQCEAVTQLNRTLCLALAFDLSVELELLLEFPVPFRIPFAVDVGARSNALVVVGTTTTAMVGSGRKHGR